ncbi:Gfo/Idh/MocA family oxidoreductase [Pontibacter harenae]|uniref:Gfo/Idh/MocA family oxidoreductase n=1 Tax=Pontibacter harenae TaxID=2894083 RepID=UPI001E3E2B85|nr:Gfo/Idh/MocA family oxidoreductase [Pontibacter harenae]MCC9165528.1 Gfo/Idh/MocA family oxidoreductase [Pontibacter harenae]
MSKTIKVGLVGYGMAGRVFHAPFITNVEGFQLKKIRETREENISVATSLYPDTEIVNDTQAILSDENIDFVVLATPNSTHYSLVKEVLQAGKHVLVDKPFTATTAEADELIALAKKQNKLLTVFQNRRWDSDFKTVKKVVESQLLGNLVEYEAHFDRFRNFIKPDTWKEENHAASGIVYDLCSHLIDQALYLFGLPQEVYGDLRVQRQGSHVTDNAEIVLYYDQLKVILKAGMLVKEAGPHFRLLGDQGSFTKYGMDVQEEILKTNQLPKHTPNWGAEPEELWGNISTNINGVEVRGKVESEIGDYTGLYQNVYKALVGEEELVVKPEQARDVVRIIELTTLSSQEKRRIAFS